MDKKALGELMRSVTAATPGQKFNTSAIRDNPEMAAIISKLVQSPKSTARKHNTDHSVREASELATIGTQMQNEFADYETILEIFPDLEMAKEILVSGVCSPKDLAETNAIYGTLDTVMTPSITRTLVELAEKYGKDVLKINDNMDRVVEDVLINTGSYVTVVIPENVLDDIINRTTTRVTTEHLGVIFTPAGGVKTLGYLGDVFGQTKGPRLGIESFMDKNPRKRKTTSGLSVSVEDYKALEPLLPEITDNFNLLKLPRIIKLNNEIKVKEQLGLKHVSLENRSLFKSPTYGIKTLQKIDTSTASRRSVGRPLLIHWPSESAIPATMPGDPTKSVGMFLLADSEGYPVSRETPSENLSQHFSSVDNNGSNQNKSAMDLLVQRARSNLTDGKSKVLSPEVIGLYTTLVEEILTKQLQTGLLGSNTKISVGNSIGQLMLSRALSGQYTRMLFVPSELVSHIAYRHNKDGTGRSLMAGIKTAASYRAIMQFARTMAQLKNSINRTRVNLKLDPDDADYERTIEISKHEIARARQSIFPLGLLRPESLTDWSQKAGIEMVYEGHPALPDMKIDVENIQGQHVVPDENLSEEFRKNTSLGLLVPPEVVDNSNSPEFATTAIISNTMISKRVLRIQRRLMPQVTEMFIKCARHDPIFGKEMREALGGMEQVLVKNQTEEQKALFEADKEGFYEALIEEFYENLTITLPKPDTARFTALKEELDTYIEGLDVVIDKAILTDYMIDGSMTSDAKASADDQRSMIKAYFIRDFLAKNSFMTEVFDLITQDEDGKPNLDITQAMSEHSKALILSNVAYVKGTKPVGVAADKDLEDQPEAPEGGGTDDGGSAEEDTGGGDTFGVEDDATAEEEPTDDADAEDPGSPF